MYSFVRKLPQRYPNNYGTFSFVIVLRSSSSSSSISNDYQQHRSYHHSIPSLISKAIIIHHNRSIIPSTSFSSSTANNNSNSSSSSSSSSSSIPQLIPSLRSKQINKEAIRLYRDILRVCKQFNFPDDQGRHWGEVLAKSARQEFENSRSLNPSSEEVTRLLVIGTDALMQVQQKFAIAEERLINAVTKDLSSSGNVSPPATALDTQQSTSSTGGILMQRMNNNPLPSPSKTKDHKNSSRNRPPTIVEVEESIYTVHERADGNSGSLGKK
jgi:hypothetical protein